MSSSSYQITPNLSLKEVLEICSKNGNIFNGEIVTVDKLISKPVITLISEGKGFCSKVYRIEFSTNKNDYSIVAKIPSIRNFEPSSDLPKEEEQFQQKQNRIKMISELHSKPLSKLYCL